MLVLSGETYEHSGDDNTKPQGPHWLGLLSDMGGPSSLVKGYVKWSNSAKTADGMVDLVSRGCQIACSPTPGPVFLTVSAELLSRNLPNQTISRTYPVPINIEIAN